MLNRTVAAGLIATAWAFAASAQTNAPAPGSAPAPTAAPAPGTPNTAPPAAAPAGTSTSNLTPMPDVRFITEQSPTEWRASKLVGLNVYGLENRKIGDINEVLIGQDGTAHTVVIGVGGFLGVGEKDVALPFKTLEWVMEPRTAAAVASQPAVPVVPAPGTPAAGASAGYAPAAPAPSAASGTNIRSDNATRPAHRGYPDHAVLRTTKDDLQNAPAFRYSSDSRARNTGPATPANPTGNASPQHR